MTNADWLKLAESRLNVLVYEPSNPQETSRLQNAIEDIKSKMTVDELALYNTNKTAGLSQKEIKEQHDAIVKAMNENRDKPSI